MPGFKVFRNDSEAHGGGTALLVSESLICQQISVPRTACLQNPTAVNIICEDANYVFISVCIPNSVINIRSHIELFKTWKSGGIGRRF